MNYTREQAQAAFAVARCDPATNATELELDGSTAAERILAAAYRELQKQYAEGEAELIEARTKAGRYLTKLIRCNNSLMDKAQRGDALAEDIVEAHKTTDSYGEFAAAVYAALDKYREVG